MSFKDVLGQDHVVQTFQKVIINDRLGQAYIFLGRDGVGRSLFAKELAKGLNCNTKVGDACDRCVNCRRIDNKTSPDVHWISMAIGRKLLGIEDIKTLQHMALLRPVESSYKVFIIQDANRLSEEAANCLLKILEEPSPSTRIVLLVSSLDSLPETVISRCQIIRFLNLSDHIVRKALHDKFKIDKDSLEWFVRVSNGSIGDAIDLIEENLFSVNEWLINGLADLRPTNNFSLSKDINGWLTDKGKTLEDKRTYLKKALNLVLSHYRDVLLYKAGLEGVLSHLGDRHRGLIERQSGLSGVNNVMKIIDEIFVAFDHLETNANITLLLDNLLTNIANHRCR